MWFNLYKDMFSIIVVLVFNFFIFRECDAVTNSNFNSNIRDFGDVGNQINATDVKTLQKHDVGSRYAGFVPIHNNIKYKDGQDNHISGSSHGRTLHAPTGYGYTDYDFGHGYEFHGEQYPHEYHPPPHVPPYHHGGYGPYYKHYDHELAAKKLLWPLAGIALLGAAAALVTNPVLLQLGVVSGKRRRRQIEEIEHITKDSIRKWSHIAADYTTKENNNKHLTVKKRVLRKDDLPISKRADNRKSTANDKLLKKNQYSEDDYDNRYIPIPLQVRYP